MERRGIHSLDFRIQMDREEKKKPEIGEQIV